MQILAKRGWEPLVVAPTGVCVSRYEHYTKRATSYAQQFVKYFFTYYLCVTRFRTLSDSFICKTRFGQTVTVRRATAEPNSGLRHLPQVSVGLHDLLLHSTAMNDGLSNLGGSNESTDAQQRTNIELVNPRHPQKSASYCSREDAVRYFEAANRAKDLPADRRVLTGEFFDAVATMAYDDDNTQLAELVSTITSEDVTIGDAKASTDD